MSKRIQTNPDKVVKRKSYYGFSRDFPSGRKDSDTYLIGDSRVKMRKKRIGLILAIIALLLLFAASYTMVSTGFYLSETPPVSQTETTALAQEAAPEITE